MTGVVTNGFVTNLAYLIRANPELLNSIPQLAPNSSNIDEWEKYEKAVEHAVYSALTATKIFGWIDKFGNFEERLEPWMQCEMDSCGDQDLWKPVIRLER